jgi:hypothetical protein
MATTASVAGEHAGLNRVAGFLREFPAVSMYSDSTVASAETVAWGSSAVVREVAYTVAMQTKLTEAVPTEV